MSAGDFRAVVPARMYDFTYMDGNIEPITNSFYMNLNGAEPGGLGSSSNIHGE